MKAIVWTMCFGLLLSGCKSQEVTGNAAQNAMGLYAQGYNKLVGDVSSHIIKDYFRKVGEELPADLDKVRLFPSHTNLRTFGYKQASQAFEQAKGAAPDTLSHLAPLADEVLKQADIALATFEQAHKYYDSDDYKDDNGAQGKTIHEKMKAVRSAYYQAIGKFEEALDVIEYQQMETELKKFANDSYGYWFRKMNLEAKRLLASATNPEQFVLRFASLDKDYQGLGAFAQAKGDGLHASFKSYQGQTDRFHSAAKRMQRLLQEKQPDEQKLRQESEHMTSAYNAMISIGNALYDLEANNILK